MRFVKTVQEAGLLVHLRIGPYACAEWNYGFVSVSCYLSVMYHIAMASVFWFYMFHCVVEFY